MNKNRGWKIAEVVLFILIVVLGILLVFNIGAIKLKNKYSSRGLVAINIVLNETSLDEIRWGDKTTKYENNEVEIISNDNVLKLGGVELKGRGNSTWPNPKKPFQLKLKNKVDLLGLGKATKWVLLANYFDASMLRNDISFSLAEMLDMKYNSRGRFVELYFNGEYEGLYYLMHKIEIAKNSVDLREKDGVLFEIDNLHSEQEETFESYFGNHLILSDIVSEDEKNIKKATENFLEAFNKLEKAAEAGNYEKVSKLIDVESFAKYYLLNEFTSNPDAYSSSFYFYKDGKNDKIHAGPAWDFDLALANRVWLNFWQIDENFFSPTETMIREREAFGKDGLDEDKNISKIFYYLMKMPEFREEVERIFKEKMSGRKEEFVVSIYNTMKMIEKSALVDQEKWERDDFKEAVRGVLKWVIMRYDYFEQEYND